MPRGGERLVLMGLVRDEVVGGRGHESGLTFLS